jgi:amino acid adenylation domain-containing protein
MMGKTEMPPVLAKSDENWTEYPRSKTIHSLFEEQASLTPCGVAVEFENRKLSYQDLNEQANRVARDLRRRGVTRETLVGLCMERSPELIVGMLAILKAGGAYVPLDPDYPDKRVAFILRDTSAPVIVAHRPTARRLAPSLRQSEVLWVDSDFTASRDDDVTNLGVDSSAEDLAYVMYTSGSTGRPKGVMIGHRSVVRLVRNTNYCQLDSSQVFLQAAPISFDASTFEVWGALLNGARLAVMAPRAPGLDELGAAIRRHKVTTLWLTSGLFNLVVEQRLDDLRSLKQLLVGGDTVSSPHVQKALDILDDGVIINGYGPTESTTFACCFRMTKGYKAGATVPIGQPISNTSVCVLDDELRPVPAGSPGELCIGGDGLARGYLNNPELTRQKFISDPRQTKAGARLYRTGDLSRCLLDGNIEFMGRLDDQVKILGHRVEPGEVEAALSQHAVVRRAVVVGVTARSGGKRLVAYIVPSRGGAVSTAELRDFLARHLPPYMVPSVFVELAELPLSPNGKVDRSALPDPEQRPSATLESVSQETELEQVITRIMRQVLDREVGPTDNFFDSGGDSLQLIEAHSELQKVLNRELSIIDLFEFPTVNSLTRHLEKALGPDEALEQSQERARKQKEALASQKRSKVAS